jgi:hypothetical protein
LKKKKQKKHTHNKGKKRQRKKKRKINAKISHNSSLNQLPYVIISPYTIYHSQITFNKPLLFANIFYPTPHTTYYSIITFASYNKPLLVANTFCPTPKPSLSITRRMA